MLRISTEKKSKVRALNSYVQFGMAEASLRQEGWWNRAEGDSSGKVKPTTAQAVGDVVMRWKSTVLLRKRKERSSLAMEWHRVVS